MASSTSNVAENLLKNQKNMMSPEIYPAQYRVLIVEDDPFSQKLFSHMANDVFPECQILIAPDYNEARKLLIENENFDLAVIDVFLDGDRSGIDVLNFLRRTNTNISILMTSNLPPETFYDLANPNLPKPVYLRKPFHPDSCRYIMEELQKEQHQNKSNNPNDKKE